MARASRSVSVRNRPRSRRRLLARGRRRLRDALDRRCRVRESEWHVGFVRPHHVDEHGRSSSERRRSHLRRGEKQIEKARRGSGQELDGRARDAKWKHHRGRLGRHGDSFDRSRRDVRENRNASARAHRGARRARRRAPRDVRRQRWRVRIERRRRIVRASRAPRDHRADVVREAVRSGRAHRRNCRRDPSIEKIRRWTTFGTMS